MFLRRRLLPLAILCGLAILVDRAIFLALADIYFRQNTLESAQKATRLAPYNANYHALLAEMLEANGENADAELEIATSLSPHESRYWIRRAFRAEVEQRYDDSERFLKEARQVDLGFDPRWALMNYYFRRGKWPAFWTTAGETLEMSYGSLDPIFRLCLAADPDPSSLARILPPRRTVLLAYFTYLTQNKLVASASSVAVRLASGAEADEVPILVDYCVRQLGNDDESSLSVWNILCRRHLLPFAELAPDRGLVVTNGDFGAGTLHQGFDWKYATTAGVAIHPMDTLQGLSIDLTGDQADWAPILEEVIPLASAKRYVISYEYRLNGAQTDCGLQWALRGMAGRDSGNSEPLAASPVLSGNDWSTGHMAFSTNRQGPARLVLQYRRLPGTVRWKGTVQLRRVTSELAKPDSRAGGSGQ